MKVRQQFQSSDKRRNKVRLIDRKIITKSTPYQMRLIRTYMNFH